MTTYTAKQILAFTTFKQLFSRDNAERELRVLKHRWHPDRNTDPLATDVFNHISALYALGYVASEVEYINSAGQQCAYKVKARTDVAFGKMYLRNGSVAFVFHDDMLFLKDLFIANNAAYKDKLYKSKHFNKYDYSVVEVHPIKEPESTLILRLPNEFVPVKYILKHFNGAIDPKIVAWIISRCFDWAMLMDSQGLVANGFDPELLFVCLPQHTILDIGSFIYSAPKEGKLVALSANTVNFYPQDCLDDKIARSRCDIALIKSLGIKLLGDPTGLGTMLRGNKNIPEAMLNFLMFPSTDKKLEAYQKWQQDVLIKAFSKREFYRFVVPSTDLLEQVI